MIYLIGLLRAHQVNFADYAWKAYKTAKESDGYQAAREFRDIVLPDCVPVHFVGVWDTVSSVIVPGRLPFSKLRLEELPFTGVNPAVQVFRHAMAIDEFRRMFRVKAWTANQVFKPNPHSQSKPTDQDIRQVWFAGCHSDVGGGFVEDQSALSKFPLLWMLEQAKAQGLILRTAMINHIVRGQPLAGARDYQKPDPAGQLHSSMQWYWKIAEIWPKRVRASEWPNRKGWIGYYLPLGEPRYIEPESLIHISVIERMRVTAEYHPKNLPDIRTEESLTGPNTVKGKPPSSARRA